MTSQKREHLLRRSQQDVSALISEIAPVVAAVRDRGDEALIEYISKFDGVTAARPRTIIGRDELVNAAAGLPPEVVAALDYAIENVRTAHAAQVGAPETSVEPSPGIVVGERLTPIERVGLYVPSGRGRFPSMAYMLAVPAVLAGVDTTIVATPPNPDGTIDPAVQYALHRCGVDGVLAAGGAHAIAALAYGTETVPSVYKIVGPGSAYVAAAKAIVAGDVDTGLPAGPSESIVLADGSTDPRVVALDLMTEAEHGADSAALLVTHAEEFAQEVLQHVGVLAPALPARRRAFVEAVLSGYGGVVLTESPEESYAVVNAFAPEHLLIHTQEPRSDAYHIKNAGEILLGPHTAFSLANYALGANAVLPTGGWARTYGPVSVRDFQKVSSIVEVSRSALDTARSHVIALADYEQFPAHAAALRRRDGS